MCPAGSLWPRRRWSGPRVRRGPHDAQDAHHARRKHAITDRCGQERTPCIARARNNDWGGLPLIEEPCHAVSHPHHPHDPQHRDGIHPGQPRARIHRACRHHRHRQPYQRLHLPRHHPDQPGTRVAGRRRIRGRKRRLHRHLGQQRQLAVRSLHARGTHFQQPRTRCLRWLPWQVQRHRELRCRRVVLLVSRRLPVRLQQRRHPRGVRGRHRGRERENLPRREILRRRHRPVRLRGFQRQRLPRPECELRGGGRLDPGRARRQAMDRRRRQRRVRVRRLEAGHHQGLRSRWAWPTPAPMPTTRST